MQNCLVNELKRLKGSSKEAVENLDSFSEFKRYMHVTRKMQYELENIVDSAGRIDYKQLILVCGSVGDGKSHLISYEKNETTLLEGFILHNDATESFRPNQTSIETLNEVLKEFRDDNLENGSNVKVVLAINLGTLNNFIDSEVGKEYSRLREFVINKKIFEEYIGDTTFDKHSYFQYINFSDYHLYSLTEEATHIDSTYIVGLINRIVQEDNNNPFYKSYKSSCYNCNLQERCPVKHNYELLKYERVQKAIVNILAEAIIKDKIIVSTRSLLNFLYDILVHHLFSYEKFNLIPENEFLEVYVKAMMPNLLFEHGDLSYILNSIESLDPMNIRTSDVDDIIIKFNILHNIKPIFENYLEQCTYFEFLFSNDIDKISMYNKDFKRELLKLLIRGYRLIGKPGVLEVNDQYFNEYVKYLYYFNKGKKSGLKKLYDDIIEAIYKWNGKAEQQHANIITGKNQFSYKISQQIKVKACVDELVENEKNSIYKFMPYIKAKFMDESEKIIEEIRIDYSLFKLLCDVKNGYRPNVRDKNQFINFVNFIDKIYEFGSKNNKLVFTEKNRENARKFFLEENSFGFVFEEIDHEV